MQICWLIGADLSISGCGLECRLNTEETEVTEADESISVSSLFPPIPPCFNSLRFQDAAKEVLMCRSMKCHVHIAVAISILLLSGVARSQQQPKPPDGSDKPAWAVPTFECL